MALFEASRSLADDACIVEIGAFLGCSTVLLAGARKLRQSGQVHTVDPFDGSGDDYSVPVYRRVRDSLEVQLRERFERNIRDAGVDDWVTVYQGRALEIASVWSKPVDLLFLDGDQSPMAVRATYAAWVPFLKGGGTIALHNSSPGVYAEGHDGSMRLADAAIRPPHYDRIRLVGTITFARKAGAV